MSILSSLDPTSVLVGGVVFLCVLWWMSTRRPPGLPPGPGPALPLLGHLHLLSKDSRPDFWRWRRQYGDVFSLYMGGKLVVVLASYSAIREALVTLADFFSDRPHIFTNDEITKGKGIVSSSGLTWKEQRKTALEILRAMGMGKNVLAERIQEEITHFIQTIRDHQGAPVDLSKMIQISVSNNICSIVFGKRYQYDDSRFKGYIKCIDDNFELLQGTAAMNFMPWLQYVPGDPFKLKMVVANADSVYAFVDDHVKEHKKTVQGRKGVTEGEEEDTDFIFRYLHQIDKQKTPGNTTTTLNDENLLKGSGDLFIAGTETTSTAIQWALLLFLHHPHVQDKCFQEVNDVIGPYRPPSMQDRPNMTYLEATICEVLRKGDIVPMNVMHATSDDVTFRDYVIPRDTMLIPCLSCVLQDPEIWGDPGNFRPERFIGPDGKLTKAEQFIPFSTGRRVCLGESLARMELFLYLATLIQHFHFLPPEEGQLPSSEGVFGLTCHPKPYQIRAVPRM